MTLTIRRVQALEILDSRGRPTLAVTVELSDGTRATAKVPSGASTGRHEAVELRDGDPGWHEGQGVRRAVASVEQALGPAVEGLPAEEQATVDRRLVELDKTADKSFFGANAILGISCAVARAAAQANRLELWRYLAGGRSPRLPVPMINVISGGLHAGRAIEFQDFMVIPHGFSSLAEALEAAGRIRRLVRQRLEALGYRLTGIADEGGWGPRLERNEAAIEILADAIARAGFRPGEQIALAVDVAATHFFRDGRYQLISENLRLSGEAMIERMEQWCRRYPLVSIEDPLAEDEWRDWRQLTARLGQDTQIVGDDLFATNLERVARGIEEGLANAVLVKMNQIGTLTETFAVVERARQAGWRAVVSARSGETEDDFLADLAVASGAGQIKIGSLAGSERLAKYNRLLEIERFARLPFDPRASGLPLPG
ncbi:MAG: phosphopyruvate hydratase [Bryobacterales bacterium]|nr:phosphopyruvate hydratase [Bryobacteraceae bacterium]MDW8354509.1 phosphopyruvate hydratase [Bryobacterales bacterium]